MTRPSGGRCIRWDSPGAPIRPSNEGERALTPRLDAIIPWLDYLIDMGANGLLLGPVFASETHGYDTVDYYRIDSRLGR